MNITRRSFLPLLAAPFVVRAASLMPVSSAKLIVPDYRIIPPYDGPPVSTTAVFKYDGETWVFTSASGGPGYPHLDFNVLYADGKAIYADGNAGKWWLTT